MSVTIEVRIPDDLMPLLERKARGAGLDREQYLRSLVSRDLTGPKRLEEVLSRFRDQVAASEISDADLMDLFRATREDASTNSQS